jgi:coproporphyrinogen III oxidase-like Fe-S oxidoreductase
VVNKRITKNYAVEQRYINALLAEWKRTLYETGCDRLELAGDTEIGMDYFAKPYDSLSQAMQSGTLHRNFMGYTTTQTQVLSGLPQCVYGS